MFQHTAARRRLAIQDGMKQPNMKVSTHSRPKAAGVLFITVLISAKGFNTQPPEGGWSQPGTSSDRLNVSTHSRPKAAGSDFGGGWKVTIYVSTHSRPKAAGCLPFSYTRTYRVSTHSRPKAAGAINQFCKQ